VEVDLKKVEIQCDGCGAKVLKSASEFNRSKRLGRKMFCSLSCTALTMNAPRKSKEIIMVCPGCGKTFITTTHNKAKRHCSRSCASSSSMSEERRSSQRLGGILQKGNLLTASETLKRREKWKYSAIRDVLVNNNRKFELEYKIEEYVFDLALLDVRILVEFDGPYHFCETQKKLDQEKELTAKKYGFSVVRRKVIAAKIIDPITIANL
jgi:very-short-patch-repair endonuclease